MQTQPFSLLSATIDGGSWFPAIRHQTNAEGQVPAGGLQQGDMEVVELHSSP